MKHNKIYENGTYIPQRMCIACRCVKPKRELLRVSLYDSKVNVDNGECKSGRGVYVCKSAECIEKAQKTRGFERGLKTKILPGVYEECLSIVGK